MAIYHCTIKTGGRAAGQSAVAAAAYRSGEKLIDKETGIVSDYTRKGGVVHSEVSLCQNAPSEYGDREKLWNAVHNIEKASNARLWREIEVALPQEMNLTEQIQAVREYVSSLTDRGMCADWSLHDKSDGNPHAHIMLTTRSISENGTWAAKSRKIYDLDENGEKIYQRTDKQGRKQYKSHKEDFNDWNEKERVEEWRETWANVCNKYLTEKKIDHRSYERQGKEQEPTVHEGFIARQIENKGGISELCQENREIKARNSLLQQITEQLKAVGAELKQLIEQKGSVVNDRIGELLRRRAASKSERGVADGKRTDKRAAAEQPTGETENLIRQSEAVGASAKTNVANTTASRADREAVEQRQRIEAERRIREAEQRAREESQRAVKGRSRGGMEL